MDGLYVHIMAVNEIGLQFYRKNGFLVEKEETVNEASARFNPDPLSLHPWSLFYYIYHLLYITLYYILNKYLILLASLPGLSHRGCPAPSAGPVGGCCCL